MENMHLSSWSRKVIEMFDVWQSNLRNAFSRAENVDRYNQTIAVTVPESYVEQVGDKFIVTLDAYTLKKSGLTPAFMASLFSDWLNSMSMDAFTTGFEVGLIERGDHRTLQGSFAQWLLGALSGLGMQEHSDPRNETAINNCQVLWKMLNEDNGVLRHQRHI